MYIASYAAEHCDAEQAWELIALHLNVAENLDIDLSQLVGTP